MGGHREEGGHRSSRGVRRKTARKTHIKYEGIQPTTERRYRKAITRFFGHLTLLCMGLPNSLEELDEAVGEFINHLYLDDYPQYWATDLISALKRFYPKCRRHLEIASLYHKNWLRVTVRTRALPASLDIVLGMAAVALIESSTRLAFIILLGFIGLLRAGELITLTGRQLALYGGGSLLVVSLPESKSAKRSGSGEQVTVVDPLVLKLAAVVLKSTRPEECVYPGTWRTFAADIRRLGLAFGITSPRFTPYCLRRGGATWHFTKYCSYDATQHLGRWDQAKTARVYIDQATAEASELRLPDWAQQRLGTAKRCLQALVRQAS